MLCRLFTAIAPVGWKSSIAVCYSTSLHKAALRDVDLVASTLTRWQYVRHRNQKHHKSGLYVFNCLDLT